MTPIHLIVGHNTATALVGRNQTPLDDADAGIRAQFDQALTNHDGATNGPLVTGPWTLTPDGRLVPRHD